MPLPKPSLTRREFVELAVAGLLLRRGNAFPPGLQPTPAAAPRRRVGLNVHRADAPALALLKKLGVTQVRFTLYWREFLDPRRFTGAEIDPHGITPAERFRGDIGALRSAGLDIVVVVHSPPAGMTLEQGIVELPRFIADRAVEFRGITWQVLNEMDGEDSFNNGWFHAADRLYTSYQQGAQYGRLLAPVYDAVKGADRSANVVCGGIAYDPVVFFDGLSQTAKDKYDALAVHCYGKPVLAPFRAKSIAMRRVLGRTPIWCTEWGFDTTDDAAQMTELRACLDDNDRNHRYDRNYLYALATDAAGGDHYGIASFDGVMRPAANLLVHRPAP